MPWPPTRRTLAAAAAALAAIACLGTKLAPRDTALLIGVGDYPSLSPALRLQASAGDVDRLERALVQAGLDPAAVTVMTERRGERPTRAAILAALARAAEGARAGDRVLIYFSGHGAQAPARRPGREPDGLEELFLAADAAGWDGGQEIVPGAIADFELEDAIAAIRARGADVWLVADACHAAGVTRSGLAADARVKSVSLVELGLPAAPLRSTAADTAPVRGIAPAGADVGRFTGFYAAAPGALAVERRLPPGAPDARPASVFTFALSRAIAQGRTRSYRDLFLALGEAGGLGAAPRPVADGSLDAAPLALDEERLFRVTPRGGELVLDAGAAEGFDVGDEVELTPGTGERSLGRTRVVRSGFAEAALAPLERSHAGLLFARRAEPTDAALLPRGRRLARALERIAGAAPAVATEVEARLWSGGCGPNPAASAGFPRSARPFALVAPPPLGHCDVLYVRVTNTGEQALDVSPLYLDAAGAVTALSLAPVDDVRLEPGQTRWLALRILTRDREGRPLPTGVERLALVVAEAGRERRDLRSLADAAVLRGGDGDLPQEGIGALVFALAVGK